MELAAGIQQIQCQLRIARSTGRMRLAVRHCPIAPIQKGNTSGDLDYIRVMASALREDCERCVMPISNPDPSQDRRDKTRDEPRTPPSNDRDEPAKADRTKDQVDRDTDPDSPDADVDRDDMIDEP